MRILLVEDEDVVRDLLADELSRQGHEVIQARDRESAASPGLEPEVLITDVKLPDGSGVDLMNELRSRTPGLKVMLMSGYDRDQLPAEAHFLRKPFRIGEFREAVRALLEG